MAIVKRFDETSQVPELWMATGIESPKVGEVKQHCRVNISLQGLHFFLLWRRKAI
jgi:general stress protein 26